MLVKSIMPKKIKPNKIYDKYTNKSISIATATKRLKLYETNQYDIYFPFILGENIVYNPYLNNFITKEEKQSKKQTKKEKKQFKNVVRENILLSKQKSKKEKIEQRREEKKKQLLELEKDQIKNFKKVSQYAQTDRDKLYGIRKYQLRYNANFNKINKNKLQKITDSNTIFSDVNKFVNDNIAQGGMARIMLYSPSGPSGKSTFSTRVSENPSIDEILDHIQAVLNSDESFDLSDSVITVKFYDIPKGQGCDPITPVPKWLKDKSKSVFIIENKDKLCGQRCLVLGMANADRKKYLRKKCKEELFTAQAHNLGKEIDVLSGMNFLDFNKFVNKYPKYKVSIVADLNTILYETDNTGWEEEIFIYYDKRIEHYHYINSIDGFFNDKNGHYKFCRQCRKRLEKRVFDKHKCLGLKCNLCGMTFQTQEEKEAHMKSEKSLLNCSNCNLKCRGDKCLELHQNGNGKRKGCSSNQWFFDCCMRKGYNTMDCWGRQEDKEIHECDHAFCKTCDEYKPRNHRCWIKPRVAKDKGLVSLIAFDFESFINEDTGEHTVNYIVAQERGTNRLWEWKYDNNDILKEFIDFVFTKPKTTFIAHNGKAYDTWLIHYYITKHYNERPTKIILAGQKIMYMEIKSVKFIDSVNHFACKLEAVPKTFGLDESKFKKGFYPYKFNTKENWDYQGCIPDIKYFDPCSMMPNKRVEFFKWWYSKKQNNILWNHKIETQEYCISDVNILLEGCNVYSQEGLDLVGIDPLEKKTIAGWVMDIYLKKFYDFDKSPICVLSKPEYDFIRKSFHGGRTETFSFIVNGIHKNYNLDVVGVIRMSKVYILLHNIMMNYLSANLLHITKKSLKIWIIIL